MYMHGGTAYHDGVAAHPPQEGQPLVLSAVRKAEAALVAATAAGKRNKVRGVLGQPLPA